VYRRTLARGLTIYSEEAKEMYGAKHARDEIKKIVKLVTSPEKADFDPQLSETFND
jgi:hypothetical protein